MEETLVTCEAAIKWLMITLLNAAALSDCMRLGVPCLAIHLVSRLFAVEIASYLSYEHGTASANFEK